MPPTLYDPSVSTPFKIYSALQFVQLLGLSLALMVLASSVERTTLILCWPPVPESLFLPVTLGFYSNLIPALVLGIRPSGRRSAAGDGL